MKDQSPVVQEELVAESFEEEQLGWVWQQGWMMKGQWCPEKRSRLGFPRVVVAVGQVDSGVESVHVECQGLPFG